MSEDCRKSCITVGTFDGVHRGHRKVIETLLENSREKGLRPIVITFSNHPLTIVAPERAPGRILAPEEESRILTSLGVEVKILEFTESLMKLSAKEWMQRLVEEYCAEILVMGYDNTFGHDGIDMNLSDYVLLGNETGLSVVTAPLVPGISSSAVRKALRNGDITVANDMLGHPFEISGTVIKGDALGRKIGFPTANLNINPDLIIPKFGVYAALVKIEDSEKIYKAVVNIGVRPTLETGGEKRFEVHLFDFKGDLYGQKLKVLFMDRLRDETHFSSLEELTDAIAKDCKKAESVLHV